jgi:hypothetical protein
VVNGTFNLFQKEMMMIQRRRRLKRNMMKVKKQKC